LAAAVLLTVHFLRSAGFRYVLEWKRDADVREILSDLHAYRPDSGMLRIGPSLEFEQPFNYYIFRDSLDWIQPLDREDRHRAGMDFYLLDPHDRQLPPYRSFPVVETYPVSGAALLAGTPRSR
jgi:hypothetical protein